uniref:Uncharacterized protein n=1 Tax=Anguilla anguilla TaxID=7936 RepID=A0A0E9QCS8_ANGAN
MASIKTKVIKSEGRIAMHSGKYHRSEGCFLLAPLEGGKSRD